MTQVTNHSDILIVGTGYAARKQRSPCGNMVTRARSQFWAKKRSIAAELVIVGIGIAPAVEPLLAAGGQGDNGIAVDALCQTSLPGVWAIGDCALHSHHLSHGQALRLETVQNANDMAMAVAKAITGDPQPYRALPWFLSNQYDLRLQTVGLSVGYDQEVLRGDLAGRSFSIAYLRAGKVLAFDCVNAAKDYVQGKALVAAQAMISPVRLADASVPLKDMAVSPEL